ncbi:MAG: FKBP-type peptidyl-prolyl cis-trans isomerase [Flavobacteriales bacterium]|nr:FKBP-type peptidyl-prolyl cis-trans isomerase [Flavobacteriales bacterium]
MSKWLVTLVALVLFACAGSPYPGYKEVSTGVHLRYITLGEGERLVGDSDSVHVRFRMSRLNEETGSFWSTDQWFLGRELRFGAMVPVLRRLHVGDSMSVMASATSWPWYAFAHGNAAAADTTIIRTEVSLLELRTPQQIRAAAERLRLNDPAEYERRLIAAYLRSTKGEWTRWGTSDMHYRITGAATDTNAVLYHEKVQLVWEGRRLEDGRVFDVQGRSGSTFPWSFGTPDQLIKGLQTAVSLLREGQEGTFVMPSSLAFGAHGIPGAVEPHTPVIYTIKLVSVGRAS